MRSDVPAAAGGEVPALQLPGRQRGGPLHIRGAALEPSLPGIPPHLPLACRNARACQRVLGRNSLRFAVTGHALYSRRRVADSDRIRVCGSPGLRPPPGPPMTPRMASFPCPCDGSL
jgi:hypothetical protein